VEQFCLCPNTIVSYGPIVTEWLMLWIVGCLKALFKLLGCPRDELKLDGSRQHRSDDLGGDSPSHRRRTQARGGWIAGGGEVRGGGGLPRFLLEL